MFDVGSGVSLQMSVEVRPNAAEVISIDVLGSGQLIDFFWFSQTYTFTEIFIILNEIKCNGYILCKQ